MVYAIVGISATVILFAVVALYMLNNKKIKNMKGELYSADELVEHIKQLAINHTQNRDGFSANIEFLRARLKGFVKRIKKETISDSLPLYKQLFLNEQPYIDKILLSIKEPIQKVGFSHGNIYDICREIVVHSQASFEVSHFLSLIEAYQSQKTLNYDDISLIKYVMVYALAESLVCSMEQPEYRNDATLHKYTLLNNAAETLKKISGADNKVFCSRLSHSYCKLMQEHSKVFENSDFQSQDYCLRVLSMLSKKYRIDETKLADTAVMLANSTECGSVIYFLREGKQQLLSSALKRKIKIASQHTKQTAYVLTILLGAVVATTVIAFLLQISGTLKVIAVVAALIVNINNAKIIVNAVLSRNSLDYTVQRLKQNDIGDNQKTLLLVAQHAQSKEDILDGFNKLLSASKANKQSNLAFGIVYQLPPAKIRQTQSDSQLKDFAGQLFSDNKLDAQKFCFFARRIKNRHNKYVTKKSTAMYADVANYFVDGDADMDVVYSSQFVPQFMITMSASDTIMPHSVVKLVSCIDHPYNNQYGMIAVPEKTNAITTIDTGYSGLFSNSKGIFANNRDTSKVYKNVFGTDNFEGKGIIRISKLYEAAKILKNKVYLSSYAATVAAAGCVKVSDINIYRTYPSTHREYSLRVQDFIYSSYQMLPFIFYGKANKRQIKFSVIQKWMFADNINIGALNAANFALLLISSLLPAAVLPLSIVLMSYLLLPVINIVVQAYAVPKGKPFVKALKSGGDGFMQSLFGFVMLPHFFAVNLFMSMQALIWLFADKKYPSFIKSVQRGQEKDINNTLNYMIPNFVAATLFIGIGLLSANGFRYLAVISAVVWMFGSIYYYLLNQEHKQIKNKIEQIDTALLRDIVQNITSDLLSMIDKYGLPTEEIFSLFDEHKNVTADSIAAGLVGLVCAKDLDILDSKMFIAYVSKLADSLLKLDKHKGLLFSEYNSNDGKNNSGIVYTQSNAFYAAALDAVLKLLSEVEVFSKDTLVAVQEKIFKLQNIDFKFLLNSDSTFNAGYDCSDSQYIKGYAHAPKYMLAYAIAYRHGLIDKKQLTSVYKQYCLQSASPTDAAEIFIDKKKQKNQLPKVRYKRAVETLNEFGQIDTVEADEEKVTRKNYTHNQCLFAAAIDNTLNSNIMHTRFGVSRFLKGTKDENLLISGTETDRHATASQVFTEFSQRRANVFTNKNYALLLDDVGNGNSVYKKKIINEQGGDKLSRATYLAVDDEVITTVPDNKKDNAFCSLFKSYANIYYKKTKDYEISKRMQLTNFADGEMCHIAVKNNTDKNTDCNVTFYSKLSCSELTDDNAYTQNNSVLSYATDKNTLIFQCSHQNKKATYVAYVLLGDINETVFCVDSNQFFGRGDEDCPRFVLPDKHKYELTKTNKIDCAALKTKVELQPGSTTTLACVTVYADSYTGLMRQLRAVRSFNFTKRELDVAPLAYESGIQSRLESQLYLRLANYAGASVDSDVLEISDAVEEYTPRIKPLIIFYINQDTLKTELDKILLSLNKLYNCGLNFNTLFLYDGEADERYRKCDLVNTACQESGIEIGKIFVYAKDSLTDKQLKSEELSAAARYDCASQSFKDNYSEITVNTQNQVQNTVKTVMADVSVQQQNILCDDSLGSVQNNYDGCTFNAVHSLTQSGQNEVVYFSENDKVWSLTQKPVCADKAKYSVNHTKCLTKYKVGFEKINAEADVFVANGSKFYDLTLKNSGDKARAINTVFYLELKNPSHYCVNNQKGCVIIVNRIHKTQYYLYLADSKSQLEVCTDKQQLFGRTNAKNNPLGINQKFNATKHSSCVAVKVKSQLTKGQKKQICLILSNKTDLNSKDVSEFKQQATQQTTANGIKIKSDNKYLDEMLNSRLPDTVEAEEKLTQLGHFAIKPHNSILSNLAVLYTDLNKAKQNILKICSQQTLRGDLKYQCLADIDGNAHKQYNNYLLLSVLVAHYVEFSGDTELLDCVVPYLKSKSTEENIYEYAQSEVSENVYAHCIRALKKYKLSSSGLCMHRNSEFANDIITREQTDEYSLCQSMLHFYALKMFMPLVNSTQQKLAFAKLLEKIREAVLSVVEGLCDSQHKNTMLMWLHLLGIKPNRDDSINVYISNFINDMCLSKASDFAAPNSILNDDGLLYFVILHYCLGISYSSDRMNIQSNIGNLFNYAKLTIRHNGKVYDVSIKKAATKKFSIDNITLTNHNYVAFNSGDYHIIDIETP